MHAEQSNPASSRSALRTFCVSGMGTALEFYDFIIYGTAAALVFPQVFFPQMDHLTATLVAFSAFGAGFARPLGGLVFGHYGDRIGRQKVLVATLLLMGLSTFLIGCLPSHASIGVVAPILLVVLRLIQGFAAGGEWGGAALFGIESARRRAGEDCGVALPAWASASVASSALWCSPSSVPPSTTTWWILPGASVLARRHLGADRPVRTLESTGTGRSPGSQAGPCTIGRSLAPASAPVVAVHRHCLRLLHHRLHRQHVLPDLRHPGGLRQHPGIDVRPDLVDRYRVLRAAVRLPVRPFGPAHGDGVRCGGGARAVRPRWNW